MEVNAWVMIAKKRMNVLWSVEYITFKEHIERRPESEAKELKTNSLQKAGAASSRNYEIERNTAGG